MNIEFSFETLRRLGLTPAMAQSLATADVANNTGITLDATPPQWMRVAAVHRETVEVHDGTVQSSARCAARLHRAPGAAGGLTPSSARAPPAGRDVVRRPA